MAALETHPLRQVKEEAIAIAGQASREMREDAWRVGEQGVWPDSFDEGPVTLSAEARPSIAEVRIGLRTIDGYPHWHGVIYRVTLDYEGAPLQAEIDSAVMIPDGRTVSSHLSTPTVSVTTDRGGSVSIAGEVTRETYLVFRFQQELAFELLDRIR